MPERVFGEEEPKKRTAGGILEGGMPERSPGCISEGTSRGISKRTPGRILQ